MTRSLHPLLKQQLAEFGLLQILLGTIIGFLLLAMMGLTVADVIGRYLFNAPITGATELTEVLLVCIIFMGLPIVCLEDSHISADLLVDHFPARIQTIRHTLLPLLSFLILAVVCWRLWVYAQQIASYHGTTNSLRLPVAPVAYFCSITTGIAALISLYLAGNRCIHFARKN